MKHALTGIPDPDREPVKFREWLEKRSAPARCPACGGTWERVGGRAGEVEICPDCWDKGVRPWKTGEPPAPDRAERLEAVGVPLRFRGFFRERRWPVAHTGQPVETWEGQPPFVGFIGDSGSGKTALATELLWRRMQAGKGGLWTRADLLVQAVFRNADLADEAICAPVLLIDDLGWGVLGQAIEKLFGIIATRHDEELETIWTSNQPMTHYAESGAGEALVRRLRDDGLLVPVKGNWKDALIERSGRVLGEEET